VDCLLNEPWTKLKPVPTVLEEFLKYVIHFFVFVLIVLFSFTLGDFLGINNHMGYQKRLLMDSQLSLTMFMLKLKHVVNIK